MALTADQHRRAIRSIAAWRADSWCAGRLSGVRASRLAIIDRSARPHAEWYALTCPACGLSETLHIPLGAAVHTLD